MIDETQIPDYADQFPVVWLMNVESYQEDDLSTRYGDAVKDQLSRYKNRRILDAGCASTTGVPALAGENNSVVQLDRYAGPMRLAERFADLYEQDTGISIPTPHVQADITQLPFPDNSFDVIFAGAVLSEGEPSILQDYDHELYRVLSPGGDLLLTSGYIGRADNVDEALSIYNSASLLTDEVFDTAHQNDALLTFEQYNPV